MDKRTELQTKMTSVIIDNKKGLYAVSPRFGKTKATIDALKNFIDKNVLISVPYENLISTWKKEFEKWDKFNANNIEYICHSSLDKFSRKGENFKPDILIIDEIHTALSFSRLNAIRRFNPERLIGLSGSLGQKHINLLKTNLDLNILYEYTVDESVEDGIVKDYEIHIHRVPLDISRTYVKQYKRSKVSHTEMDMNLILSTEVSKAMDEGNPTRTKFAALARARFLYNLRSKNEKAIQLLNGFPGRCIVFTQLSAVADSICNHSHHNKSRNNSLELFLEEKIQKLSVVNMTDMGITFPNLHKAILVSIQASEDKAIQRILRTMTLDENHPKAQIHIVISAGTQEEKWLKNAIKSFDQNKIKYHDN